MQIENKSTLISSMNPINRMTTIGKWPNALDDITALNAIPAIPEKGVFGLIV